MAEFAHKSVLLNESINSLKVGFDGIYVDGTTGGGGHSESIAQNISSGKLVCIDRDVDALAAAKERLKKHENITFVKDNYKNLKNILNELNITKVDGILLDLGVSSYQLDTEDRGFSYMNIDAPLDMRMDRDGSITAQDIVNEYEEFELAKIFKEYGEEKFSKRIASEIAKRRQIAPLKTTGDLVEIVDRCIPKSQSKKSHPAKRVFQAIRIEVNEELTGLYEYILSLPDLLNKNGRICIITFHSLEDRIVKQAYKKLANPCECPKEFPVCVCNKKPKGTIITRKPILPSDEEIEKNSRSKSAKLRVFESF